LLADQHVVAPPMLYAEERTVPLPRFLAEQITGPYREVPRDLVFQGTRGGVLRNGNFNRRTFGPAAIAIGEPRLTPDGLRHTAPSLAIVRRGALDATLGSIRRIT
jgi:integrase